MDRGAFQTKQNTSFVTKNKKCSRSTESYCFGAKSDDVTAILSHGSSED